jgi:hypothetical protein
VQIASDPMALLQRRGLLRGLVVTRVADRHAELIGYPANQLALLLCEPPPIDPAEA